MSPMVGQQLIGGEWQAGQGQAWQRSSPSDGALVWDGTFASTDQVQAAVEAAHASFPAWAETSLESRIDFCRAFESAVREKSEELATLIATENGKPLWEAKTEVAASIAKVKNSIDSIMQRRWTTTEQLGDFRAVTRYRPHGVMFVIGPFNFPAHVPGGHIIPALLAGNTLVFKPSEHVPAVGQWLAEIWHSIGLPAGVLNLVHGAGDVGNVAVESKLVDGVLFTGSRRVGTILHEKMAGQPHRVLALEMGGNNPLVIHNTSDIEGAATTTILSAYITSGQRCTCSRRLIVTGEAAYQAVVEKLTELVPQIQVGLSLDADQPFMGPLIHKQAADQLLDAQEKFRSAGSKVLVEMKRDARSEALVSPCLIELASEQIVEDCEYFGPLMTVQKASDLDEAIAIAGNTEYGLSAGFFGDEVDDFHYFLHRIRAGVVNWNRQTTGASGRLPFGGAGMSGNHHPSGFHAADYCSYPIASLESHELSEAKKKIPGLGFTGNAD
ncbi:MAG: succinylglutamate-semialdehyde dehydrogenase [Planctomycetota bacterium]